MGLIKKLVEVGDYNGALIKAKEFYTASDTKMLALMGCLYMCLERYNEALGCIDSMLEYDKNDAIAQYLKVVALCKSNQVDKALKICNDFDFNRLNIGSAKKYYVASYMMVGQYQKAVDTAGKARGSFLQLLALEAKILSKHNDPTTMADLDFVLRHSFGQPFSYFVLAGYYDSLGNRTLAIRRMKTFINSFSEQNLLDPLLKH
jgi:tetratricopeptide (TPR) repeat protein